MLRTIIWKNKHSKMLKIAGVVILWTLTSNVDFLVKPLGINLCTWTFLAFQGAWIIMWTQNNVSLNVFLLDFLKFEVTCWRRHGNKHTNLWLFLRKNHKTLRYYWSKWNWKVLENLRDLAWVIIPLRTNVWVHFVEESK